MPPLMPAAMTFDHIGVAGPTLEAGREALSSSLGIAQWTEPAIWAAQGVHYQFGVDGSGMRYELLAPIDESSPVWRAVRSRVNTLNHIAYRVRALDATVADLTSRHWLRISAALPAPSFGGARIQFVLNPLGFIVELIEQAPDTNDTAPSFSA
jgi:methylmalonyl-CoA/ethylmalonyl-CoA epimerase